MNGSASGRLHQDGWKRRMLKSPSRALIVSLVLLGACAGVDAERDTGEEQGAVPVVSYTGSTALPCDDVNDTVVDLDEDEAQGSETAAAAAAAEFGEDVRQGGRMVDFGQSQGGPFGIVKEEELSAVAYVIRLPSGGWSIQRVVRCQ